MPNILDDYLKPIRELLDEGEILEAIKLMKLLDERFGLQMAGDLSQQSAIFNKNEKDRSRNKISTDEYMKGFSTVSSNLIDMLDELPKKAEQVAAIGQLSAMSAHDPTNGSRLEKMIGGTSNLLKINWLEKALKASKAVCRVTRTDGIVGTGWLIKGGYLMTNNHVLPDAGIASMASAEFNFEIDEAGQARNVVVYQFVTADFLTHAALDFTRIKVRDRADEPLSKWGFLEIDPESVPVKGEPVTIIQHPLGEDKQIALNANEVLAQRDEFLFYTTDTEQGSSGSPVFNKNWKVVALHNEGGKYKLDNSGNLTDANRGGLFRHISPLLKAGAVPVNAAVGGGQNESISIKKPEPVVPVVVVAQPAPVQAKPVQPIANQSVMGIPKLVVLYAIEDKDHALQLEKQLKLLLRQNKITAHFQHKITEGDVVGAAKSAIAEARLVAVLATNEFFFDDNNYELVENAKGLGKSIVPILVKSFNLAETGLGGLRALPSNNKFIDTGWPSADSAWLDIANGLRAVLVPNG